MKIGEPAEITMAGLTVIDSTLITLTPRLSVAVNVSQYTPATGVLSTVTTYEVVSKVTPLVDVVKVIEVAPVPPVTP